MVQHALIEYVGRDTGRQQLLRLPPVTVLIRTHQRLLSFVKPFKFALESLEI